MPLPADNIAATTLQLIRRRLADNIFKANPTIAYLMASGRVKLASGGRRIDEHLIYADNSNVQAYSGYDRLNVAPTEELTTAQFTWKQVATSISYSGIEDLQNSGPEQIINLLRTKVEIADKSMREFMDEKVHAAASTKSSKDIIGLDEIMDIDNTWSTLGGIDSNVYTWWRNRLGTNGTGGIGKGFTAAGIDNSPVDCSSSTVLLMRTLNRLMNEVSKGSQDRVKLILTSQYVFEKLENDVIEQYGRIEVDEPMKDLGFQNLRYKGATVMWNENIRSDSAGNQIIYFINPDYMSMTVHRRRNFAMSQFVSPWDQDARVAQILWAGNMTVRNRRRLGAVVVKV